MIGRAALIFISLVACLMIAGVVMTPKTVQAECFWGVCIGEDDSQAQPPAEEPAQPTEVSNPNNNGGGFCDGIGGFLCSGICSVAPSMCEEGQPKIGNPPPPDGALSCTANGQTVSCSDDIIQKSFQMLDSQCKAGSEAMCTMKEGFCLQNPGACQSNGSTSGPIKTGGAVFWGVDCDGSDNNLAACADLAKNLKTSCLRDKDGCDQYDEVCSGSATNFCNEVTKDLPAYTTGVKPVISQSGNTCPSTQKGCPGYQEPTCPSTTAGCPGYAVSQTLTEQYKQAVDERYKLSKDYEALRSDPEFNNLVDQYNSRAAEIKRLNDYFATNPENPDPVLVERYGQLKNEIEDMEQNNPGFATRLITLKNEYEAADQKVKQIAKQIAQNEEEIKTITGESSSDPIVQDAIKEAYKP